jgi:hypothetical protein
VVIIAICCVNPLLCLHAPVPTLLSALTVFAPAGPGDAELPASDGNQSEEPEAEDSEPDFSELTLGTHDDLAAGELSAIVSFWHGRGVDPWRTTPDPRPGERS